MSGSDFFEQEIRQRLEAYMMRPGERLWNKIEADLHIPLNKFFIFKATLLIFVLMTVWHSFSELKPYKQSYYLPEEKTNNEKYALFSDKISDKINNKHRKNEHSDQVTFNHKREASNLKIIFQHDNKKTDYSFLMNKDFSSRNINKPVLSYFEDHTSENRYANNQHTLSEQTNQTKAKYKHKKAVFFYFSPTISDRTFNKRNAHRSYISSSGINERSNYQPELGWEAGFAYLKNINPRIQLRSGIQFNYSCYTISAVQGAPELASLSLSGSNRMQRLSNLENRSGFKNQEYANRSFQVSIPIGVMIQLNKNRKRNLIADVSVQPSYLMQASAYLLSTNYRNYVAAPDMLRRVNIHSGAQLLYSHKIGQYRVLAGPQIRFQVLSMHKKEYPFKENIVEYGFKLGIIRDMP